MADQERTSSGKDGYPVRTFELHRDIDETGISGTGHVADGIVFDDQHVALRWRTPTRSTCVYDSVEAVEKIHGHAGKTRVVWTSDAYRRARRDCLQDHCENAPFASVGGLEKRSAMVAPKWICGGEEYDYFRGYANTAHELYGADWQTCSFGWAPALTIGGTDAAG